MAHKITKQVGRILKLYASKLPPSVYKGNEKFYRELPKLEEGEIRNNTHGQDLTVISGVVDKVLMETDRYYPINHLRRLKKAYKAEGWPGVYNYARWVDKNNERMNTEDDVKHTMLTAEQILKHKIQPIFNF